MIAEADGQSVFDLSFFPATKQSIDVDINGKIIPSIDFELIGEGNKIGFVNYKCSKGEVVHVKGNTSTK